MSPIFRCVHCGGEMQLDLQSGSYRCTACGRNLDGTLPEENDNTSERGELTRRWGSVARFDRQEMSPWMRSTYDSLVEQVHQGDVAGAIASCRKLIEMDRDFIEAHLWIARLSENEAERREHLDEVLAHHPSHLDAIRLKLMLDGELTEDEVIRSKDLYRDNVQEVEGPVETDIESLLCPVCRGNLTVNDDSSVVCSMCGFKDVDTHHAVTARPETSLAIALIKRRAKVVRWKIGERMLHCNECGAERTLPPNKMSARCPFCGSGQVVLQDALGVFRQPDGLVKFRVRRSDVEAIIEERLNSRAERMKGWFVKNRVERMTLEGMFLPFWVFDAFADVNITIQPVDENGNPRGQPERQQFTDQVRHALISGVKSPPKHLTDKIRDYDLSEIIPYTPKLLAKFAAELYTIDFDVASLEARSYIQREMGLKHENIASLSRVSRNVSSTVSSMEMQLLLLPVWVGVLVEEDDEVRTALINGQTGALAMSRARKLES